MMQELETVLNLLEGGFAQVRVLVVGDILLDRSLAGEVAGVSGTSPAPVLRSAQRIDRPGGAAAVAVNLAGLGCEAFLAGLWGEDGEQAVLARLLELAKVDTTGVVSSSLPTPSQTHFIAGTQELLRLDIEARTAIPAVHAVVLADGGKGALKGEMAATIIRAARAASIPVVVQAGGSDFGLYSGATAVCASPDRLTQAAGVPVDEETRRVVAERMLIVEHELRFLVELLREKGIRVLGPGGEFLSSMAPREVYDTAGVDGAVVATFAAALASGLVSDVAAELAGLAASVVLGKLGAAPVSSAELIAAVRAGRP
jgi:D-beta-D-heptose 7-phosphate kinase/D-beta-D-heptose 1-phosphate adenosyltransferase